MSKRWERWSWVVIAPFLVLSGCATELRLARFINSPEVLYYNGFDEESIDYYTEDNLRLNWNNPIKSNGVINGRTTVIEDEENRGNKILRVLYPAGRYRSRESGAQWKMNLGGQYNDLYCSYKIKFPKGFDFVKGGKLPGFAGGAANTGGRKPNGKDGWSARMMWRAGGKIVQYLYYPDQLSKYGENFPWCINGHECHFIPGKWHHIEQRIKMNTPGKSDGIIQGWLDGELTIDVRNIRFRDINTLGIDAFYFSTFFGGGDASWAPAKREYVYFDQFVISTKPVHFLIKKEE